MALSAALSFSDRHRVINLPLKCEIRSALDARHHEGVKVLDALCNGSVTLMRGKSATCRGESSFSFGSSTRHGQRPLRLMDQVSASPRLAPHRSGRAIAAVASKFDRSPARGQCILTPDARWRQKFPRFMIASCDSLRQKSFELS